MSTPPSTPSTRGDPTTPPDAPLRAPGQGLGLDSGEPGAAASYADILGALPPLVTPERVLQQPVPPQRDGAKRQLEFGPEDEEGPQSKRPKPGLPGGKRRKSKKRKSKRRKNKKSRRNKRR